MRAAPSPLADLLEPGLTLVTGDAALRISGIVADSRAATPGCLFVAIPGTRADGAAFVADAAARGAVAVLAAPGLTAPPGLAVIAAANPTGPCRGSRRA